MSDKLTPDIDNLSYADTINYYINSVILGSTNNFTLGDFNSSNTAATAVTPVSIDLTNTPLLRNILKLTFENIYQNIASLNNYTNMVDPKYLTRTYYLSQTDTITVITDMRTPGKITAVMSGATGIDSELVKITTYDPKAYVNVVYSLGGPNV